MFTFVTALASVNAIKKITSMLCLLTVKSKWHQYLCQEESAPKWSGGKGRSLIQHWFMDEAHAFL